MRTLSLRFLSTRIALLGLAAVAAFAAVVIGASPRSAEAAPPRESDPVWRVQVALTTCDLPGAGGDDRVTVKLNEVSRTTLNTPINDFERGQGHWYDVTLKGRSGGPATIADITELEIEYVGDHWCLAQAGLVVNNRIIFASGAATDGFPVWLGNSLVGDRLVFAPFGFEISGSRMRQDPHFWGRFGGAPLPSFPFTITKAELTARAEVVFGDTISRFSRHDWGYVQGAPVEITKVPNTTNRLQVHADLKRVVDRFFGEDTQELNVAIVVEFTCSQGRLEMRTVGGSHSINGENVNLISELDRTPLPRPSGLGEMNFALCGPITVHANGDVTVGMPTLHLPPRPR